MIGFISDLKKEADKLDDVAYDHKGKTPLELLCTLLLYWPLIRVALKFARIFTINGTRDKINQIIKLFDESSNYWVKLK